MTQVADAPYIVEAEIYGIDYPKTQLEKSSYKRRISIASEVGTARDLVDQAIKALDDTYDSIWREQIECLMEEAEKLSCKLDDLKHEIWHL